MREKEGVILKHLYRVVRLPKGSGPQYQPWHHLWLAVGLTALGIFLGVLTLFLSAGSCAELVEEDLLQHYWSSPLLCYLNLLPGVVLIWWFYFLFGRCWLAYLFTAVPLLGLTLANYYRM